MGEVRLGAPQYRGHAMKFLTALLAALLGMSLGMSSQASALTAAEYQSLRQTWKLGYVVGIAHGRALYRKGDMAAGSREATLDDCIPKMSDVEIIDAVAAYMSANAGAASRDAGDVVIAAIAEHCRAN